MDKKLIKEILEYVEETTVAIDAELGDSRSFEQILNDEDRDEMIPSFYFTLKDELR